MIDYKQATRDELLQEYKRISSVIGKQNFNAQREFLFLPKILAEKEEPIAIASGMIDGKVWLIVLTNQRVIFLDKGELFGVKQLDVRLIDIASISCETGFLSSSITISTTARSFSIKAISKKTVTPFTNLVNDARKAAETAVKSDLNQPAHIQLSRAEQLEKLATLKANGYLTEDEFLAEKEKILNA